MVSVLVAFLVAGGLASAATAGGYVEHDGVQYPLYPQTLTDCPDLPSPLTTADGREFVLVTLHDSTFGVVDVSRSAYPRQLYVDDMDFPTLASAGVHDPDELAEIRTITGRSLEEITTLARPGGLSTDGFLASDEDILTVLQGDNEIVRAMGVTHPDLARPLFHVWNLIQKDLELDRWNMHEHRWGNMTAMKYHDHWVLLDAHDTKGGQLSPFADDLEGGFWIVLRCPLTEVEEEFLHAKYCHLDPDRWDTLHGTLTRIFTGEMEPYFVMWYGFYEGHTAWRVDPVGLARIFGLRSLTELEAAFPHRLDRVTRDHHTAAP